MSKPQRSRARLEAETAARLEKSKREIDLLRAEYERLLERGIHGSATSNVTDTDKQKEILNKREEVLNSGRVSTSNCLPISSASGEPAPRRRSSAKPQSNAMVIPSPKKVRHYNVEEAREYMRKQKEKRLQEKTLRETENAIQIKKQKLKELHEKSLQIVARNRQRSKSREKPQASSDQSPTKLHMPQTSLLVRPSRNISNITYRINKQESINSNYIKSSAKSDDAKIKAATLIQAYFRGHRQRKIYGDAIRRRLNTRQQEAVRERQRKEREERRMREIQEQEELDRQKPSYPEWLQIEPNIHPYNFISSVKRKLNVAMKQSPKTSDVAIQSSFSPEVRTPPRSYREVKELIAQSLSSKKPERSVDAQIEKSLQVIKDLHLKSKSLIKCDKGNSELNLDLDARRLNDLKLKSKVDLSDSDTSKNIPDIESQICSQTSIVSAKHSTLQKPSNELIVLFKKPDAPRKPQRTFRKDLENSYPTSSLTESAISNTGSVLNIIDPIANPAERSIHSNDKTNATTCKNEDELILSQANCDENITTNPKARISEQKKFCDITSRVEKSVLEQSENRTNTKMQLHSISYNRSICSNDRSHTKTNIESSINSAYTSNNFECSSGTKRESIISGNISHVTKSFDVSEVPILKSLEETAITENLNSFRQFMTELNETKPITHTPFQPRQRKRQIDAQKRLEEVFAKVDQLDTLDQSKETNNPEIPQISTEIKDNPNGSTIDITATQVVDLQAPNINLVQIKPNSTQINMSTVSGKSSLEGVSGRTNQLHVKFEAELHVLNDFNESLRQIMNIEKSMLDLQTKYNLQPNKTESRNTQTSTAEVVNSSNSNKSNTSSKIQNSINFSRGSNHSMNELRADQSSRQITSDSVLQDNSTVNLSATGELNISEVSFNTSEQTFHNTLPLSTLSDSNVHGPGRLNSAGISISMFEQLIKDEDRRIADLKTLLKIREKALLDRTKSELTWLEIQKKQLLETGQLHEASLLKKKQRGLILKLQEERNEMQRLKEAQKAASKERKNVLKEQRNLIKAELNPMSSKKFKRSANTERRSSGPIKVYNYQSETSISRKSSVSENIVYTSRSESIISKISDDEFEAVQNDKFAIVSTATSNTEIAKRSLQAREAVLQKRREEAEKLLKWHQQLLDEERKIAELEMLASNVINQVPSMENAFKTKVPCIWNDAAVGKHSKCISDRLDSTHSNASLGSGDTSYSMEFDERNSGETGVLEKGIKQSESTLNEIIQNINNITDEISELYKISNNQSKEISPHDNQIDNKSVNKQCEPIVPSEKTVPEVSIKTQKDKKVKTGSETESINEDNSEPILSSIDELLQQTDQDVSSSIINNCQSNSESVCSKSDILSTNSLSHSDTSNTIVSVSCKTANSVNNYTQEVKELHSKELTASIQKEEDVCDFTNQDPKFVKSINEQLTCLKSRKYNDTTDRLTNGSVWHERYYNNENDKLVSEAQISTNLKTSLNSKQFEQEVKNDSLNEIETTSTLLEKVDPERELSEHIQISQKMYPYEHEKTESDVSEISKDDCVSIHSSITDLIEKVEDDITSVDSFNELVDEDNVNNINTQESSEITELYKEEIKNIDLNGSISNTDSKSSISDGLSILPIIDVVIEDKLTPDATVENNNDLDDLTEHSNSTIGSVHTINDASSKQSSDAEERNTQLIMNEESIIKDKGAKHPIDVKKRVSEILADANINTSIEEKSPRLRDIYVTTYDIVSPDNSPEQTSPVEDGKNLSKPKDIFGIGTEAQELLKKQLAIEQEIKQIERQQKEQLPYIYVREIPNKPPPPYTPPILQTNAHPPSIIPTTSEQIEEVVPHLAKLFYTGYINDTLKFLTFPDLKPEINVSKCCVEFLFDICKELTTQHYAQFEDESLVWMQQKRHNYRKPHDQGSLGIMLNNKLKQLFGFDKVSVKESMIIKWSRKKRDHVDELLVVESQTEEINWTKYDHDELIVKNDITNTLFNLLIMDTVSAFQDIMKKRKYENG